MLRGFFLKKGILLVSAFFVLLLTALFIFAAVTLNRITFYDGISIGDIDISGMNTLAAKSLVEEDLREKSKDCRMILMVGEKRWIADMEQLSFGIFIDKAIEDAYNIGRNGSIFKRLYTIASTGFRKITINPQIYYDRNKLKSLLYKIKNEVDMEACNASLNFKNGKISFIEEKTGTELDIDTNMDLIENRIINNDFGPVELTVSRKTADIKLDDIKEIKDVLSSFSTKFSLSDSGRSHNIRIASDRINNTIIMPGQIFSMNTALGPRTSENGYREAPVIFQNELVQGTGGGVCQVTSTLYVTSLKAMMDSIERSPHSRPLGYVPAGQDATIAEGSLDFKFQNNLGYPVAINSEVKGNVLSIKIYGKKDGNNLTVRLKSEIIKQYLPPNDDIILDDSIPVGIKLIEKKSRKGLKVAVYREILDNSGKMVKKELISEDTYKPARGIIRINSLSKDTPLELLTENISENAD